MTDSIEATLAQREATHGEFAPKAVTIQHLKAVMAQAPNV